MWQWPMAQTVNRRFAPACRAKNASMYVHAGVQVPESALTNVLTQQVAAAMARAATGESSGNAWISDNIARKSSNRRRPGRLMAALTMGVRFAVQQHNSAADTYERKLPFPN